MSRRKKESPAGLGDDIFGNINPDIMKQAAEVFEKAFKEQMENSAMGAGAEQAKTEV